MKKILLLLAIVVFLFGKINAQSQCSPNSLFTGLGLPGVYPPELPITGIPMTGILEGVVGVSYSQILTVVNLSDTTMDVASFLPAAIVTAMNSAPIPISTVMSLNVNHIIYSVSGLPSGLSASCDQTNCQYNSGVDEGCIEINGIPMQSGNFTVPVDMAINAQIPAITVGGLTIFPGMAIDLPSFSAVEYDLLVTDATAIHEVGSYRSKVFPNPTSKQAILSLIPFSDVVVYNILGKQVLIANNVKGDLVLSKNDIGKGVFYISVQSKNKTETIKLIIN